MTIEEFRRQLSARPFHPFDVHLADGRTIEIDHPEFVAQSPSGRTVYIHGEDSMEAIDLLLVTSLSVGPRGDRKSFKRRGA